MDYIPQDKRPDRVRNCMQIAEITYTDRETGSVVWRQQFSTAGSIPPPPTMDFPDRVFVVLEKLLVTVAIGHVARVARVVVQASERRRVD